jgi:hypothetical protein
LNGLGDIPLIALNAEWKRRCGVRVVNSLYRRLERRTMRGPGAGAAAQTGNYGLASEW